ncbi:site-specific integrase [Halosimplex rubrum]|uniref:Site-specific integrase n=1 Tax=Halosimplex rubrum TaxID=869889 RepID=A0A7D5T0U8_9EURY|nr:site-specific integrase [Halosimplex rubrum]QLH79831.1 site-specific integrase [Halosimplex rubrum]
MAPRDPAQLRATLADGFDCEVDPLETYESTFREVTADPFELFVTDVLRGGDIADRTVTQYRIAFQQWRTYMADVGRHPACPNAAHVRGFARWLQVEQGNDAVATIRQKLQKLDRAFRFWQRDSALPHTERYNPVALARDQIDWETFDDTADKSPPPISRAELQARIGSITDLRTQVQLATQLKLGLRVGELCNVRLQDVNLVDEELTEYYPLGTHERLAGRPNAIYIPSKHERDGNKSHVPRILPLDAELQSLLRRYLRVRPTWIDDWLFVLSGGGPVGTKTVNRAWKETFHPAFAETAEYRAITSHFGRHYFTTYWRTEQDLPRELVQYMRGDVVGDPAADDSAMHHYLHTYYEDIEEPYRREIYSLDVSVPQLS